MRLEVKEVKGKKYLQIVTEGKVVSRIHVGRIDKVETWKIALTFMVEAFEIDLLYRMLQLRKRHGLHKGHELIGSMRHDNAAYKKFLERHGKLYEERKKELRELEKVFGVKIKGKHGFPLLRNEE